MELINDLKKVSISELEEIIGEAISKKMNDSYACSIDRVRYDGISKMSFNLEIYSYTKPDHEFPADDE